MMALPLLLYMSKTANLALLAAVRPGLPGNRAEGVALENLI